MLPMAEAHPTEPTGRSRTHLTTPVDLAMLIQYGSGQSESNPRLRKRVNSFILAEKITTLTRLYYST